MARMAMASSAPDDWTTYWQKQKATSFGAVFLDTYDGSIREFWQRQLTGRLDEVVDIACGNGALCWLADEILNRPTQRTRITGVDFADIDPFAVLGRKPGDYPNVRFLGATLVESLPFADQSVDLVISQYGIEYADVDSGIAEIDRILKPTGGMAFLMHDSESPVVKNAIRHLEDFKSVLNLGIHDHAMRLDELAQRMPATEERQRSKEFSALVAKLDTLTKQVQDIVRDYEEQSPIHRYMNEIINLFVSASHPPGADTRARIAAARDGLSSAIKRRTHLQSAAMSETERAHLVGLIERSGFTITESATLSYGNAPNIGTTLVAERRSVTT
jgi:ubiquinone/menaquinone biosynthesis C-methylase UbiE